MTTKSKRKPIVLRGWVSSPLKWQHPLDGYIYSVRVLRRRPNTTFHGVALFSRATVTIKFDEKTKKTKRA